MQKHFFFPPFKQSCPERPVLGGGVCRFTSAECAALETGVTALCCPQPRPSKLGMMGSLLDDGEKDAG